MLTHTRTIQFQSGAQSFQLMQKTKQIRDIWRTGNNKS